MTRAQAQGLERFSKLYLLPDTSHQLDFSEHFGRLAPLVLEVGFGMGNALLSLARARPGFNVLGIEIYRPGIGAVLHTAAREDLSNVRILEGDARHLLACAFKPQQLHRINIFFPDPWPKRKHFKRRLIEPQFATLLAARLEKGGQLNIATDWQAYADWMLSVLEAEPGLRNLAAPADFAPRCENRPVTRFEARGLELGHAVWDLAYEAV